MVVPIMCFSVGQIDMFKIISCIGLKYLIQSPSSCHAASADFPYNIIADGFRFIYLAFRFSKAEKLSLIAWVS